MSVTATQTQNPEMAPMPGPQGQAPAGPGSADQRRNLAAEASERSLAGQPRELICAVLADAATRAFDLLEPSLGSYGIRAQPR